MTLHAYEKMAIILRRGQRANRPPAAVFSELDSVAREYGWNAVSPRVFAQIQRQLEWFDENTDELDNPSIFFKENDGSMDVLHYGSKDSGLNLRVHALGRCAGETCAIHNPSFHSLTMAPFIWRADIGIMERRCDHGIGHPDPDDLAYRRRFDPNASSVHGCDGCC